MTLRRSGGDRPVGGYSVKGVYRLRRCGEGVGVRASDNLAVHSRWADAEDRHDLPRHQEFVHPNIEVHLLGGEMVAGLPAYLEMMEARSASVDGFRVVLDDAFATDDRVVCRWRSIRKHAGDCSGMLATGWQVDYPGMSIWEFEDS